MIISHKYKFIYIRNPKTGSTSIENYLKKIDPQCFSSDEDIKPYGHQTYEEIKEMLPEEIFNNYFKFTFFRNPKDWIISQFAHNVNFCYSDFDQLKLICNDDGYLDKSENNIIDVNNIITLYTILKRWFKRETQLFWVNSNLDFIGQFEKLNENLEVIKKKLNIYSDEPLNKLNINHSERYKLSEDAKKIVEILYKKDIEYYNQLFIPLNI